MPKYAKVLTAVEIKNLKLRNGTKSTDYTVGGVPGLIIRVRESSKQWILKVSVDGKRHSMGLGGFPDIPLKLAREKALEIRHKIYLGENPLLEKRKVKANNSLLFSEVAYQCFNTRIKPESKSEKHKKGWIRSIEAYAFPFIGDLFINDINTTHIIKILEPIWYEKTETASRVRQRLEVIFNFAMAINLMDRRANCAMWKGNLEQILPNPSKIKDKKHYPSLPVEDLGSFLSSLSSNEGIAARALEFLIFTASRSGEVRLAKWNEFDFDFNVWSIPRSRMKANKEHKVPLTKKIVSILNNLPKIDEYVFSAPRGGALSDMAINSVIRNMDKKGMSFFDPKLNRLVVPHGFRSTFKEWARQPKKYGHHHYSDELSELALAHVNSDQTRAAYARDELLDERRPLMEDWCDFCCGLKKFGKVISLKKGA